MSRPSPFNYNKEIHDNQIFEFAKSGLTQPQIASRFDITYKTLQRLFEANPTFREAWEKGRNENIIPLISELYRMSLPHEIIEEEFDSDGKLLKRKIKYMPGNSHALLNYIRVKDPNWQENLKISPAGSNLIINITKEDEKL